MAIAHGSSVTTNGTSATTATVSSVTVTGTNPCLIVQVHWRSFGATISSVVWDAAGVNESLTAVGSDINSNANTSLHYLAAPTAKTADVTITFSASSSHCAAANVYTGVHQTTPVRTAAAATANGTDAAPTVNVTALSGEVVVDSLCQASATPDTATASKTERHNVANGGGGDRVRGCSQDVTSAGATEAMSWSMSGSDSWAIVAAPLQVAAATGVPVRQQIVPVI